MTSDKFDELWNNSIIKFATEIGKATSVKFDKSKKIPIRDTYEELRKNQKDLMQQPDNPLDRHKVGAMMAHAILKVCPFDILIGNSYSFFKRTPNEALAVYTSVQIIKDFRIAKAIQENDATIKAIFEHEFISPAIPNHKNEPYPIYLMKTLYNARVKSECNISLLANALFVLESYHERACRDLMKFSK